MTLIVYSDRYLDHAAEDHPERPDRLRAVVRGLKESGLGLTWTEPRPATPDEIRLIHTAEHTRFVQEACRRGMWIDADTYTTPPSYEVALLAVGGVLTAVEKTLAGEHLTAFCAVRPPGHHATPTRAMGFCLFNNVAIAARFIQKYGLRRVMIVDFDVHHGNGTQDAFYDDDTVLYLSTHRYPFYPGTGAADERGAGKGTGYTVNLPFPPHTPPEEFLRTYASAVREAFRRFRPEFILVSAGFDAYFLDPIGGLNLRPEDYFELTRLLMDARVPVVSALEGGYHLDGLRACVVQHVRGLIPPR